MLPTVVANELRNAVSEFLRSAFPFATPFFQRGDGGEESPTALIDGLLKRPGELFQGPYLDIKLPFRKAEGEVQPFRHLTLPFTPYQHQVEAFQRLAGDAPRSTLVATGTGSGKTECFMLPVLDDCLHRREQGIKTLIIYPMNALATDQARRFAAEVAKLDTRLSVGLFVGGEQKQCLDAMGPNNVITCHKTLRDHPPDILLTNYKMLDFLLIRPKDQPLWRFNKPGMLRYLVVDELHTFDGAQGTDLACLIRRLRDRLEAGPELACVGTSATIGADSRQELLDYAGQIFATPFDESAIILESRQTPEEYLAGPFGENPASGADKLKHFAWPERDEPRLDPATYDRLETYLFHQSRLWFPDLPPAELPQLNASDARRRAEAAVRLGELLHQHQVFHQLVRDCAAIRRLDELAETWRERLNLSSLEQARRLLVSLASLIAAARLWDRPEHEAPDKWCAPFLQLRQQLWLRELRRMVCSVPVAGEAPQLRFADDLKDSRQPLHLPLLHCRECHLGAWGGVIKKGDNHLDGDLQGFYRHWFGNSPQATLMSPLVEGQAAGAGLEQHFCPHCFRLQAVSATGKCTECEGEDLLRVWRPDQVKEGKQGLECHHDCPECGARDGLAVLGYRAATLISVMTGRLFSTPYNDDYKLIAFSDSVQDAAHRAGFLGANTWRQVVRQAMARWLVEQPEGLSLREMADLLPGWWRDRVGDEARFCGLFIAPNMESEADYAHLVEHNKLPPESDLPDLVSKRLHWECLSEFGRRGGVGRSLERTGAAAVGLDVARLARDVAVLEERLRNEIGSLRDASPGSHTRIGCADAGGASFPARTDAPRSSAHPMRDDTGEPGPSGRSVLHFVLGWLIHLRRIGAIYDPMLDGYLSNKGREYLLNTLPWMPGFGRTQRPPAPVTLKHFSNNFEALLLSNRDTWSLRWLKKTLGQEALFVAAEARQIFHLTLQALTQTGWLVEREAGGESLWLLSPDRLLIESGSRMLRCDCCRHLQPAGGELAEAMVGMPCTRASCLGTLKAVDGTSHTRAYGVTEPRRLVTSEHTGLLPSDVRARVENSFIYGDQPWDINLLSATPTLEMGIDIGDLSSVLLCSVPPAQANYLQRIGRAGRKDGNALAVTVANGQNHDLYFYQEPLEMIAGNVQPPGVFLKAIAVLERQLIAYCFDRWTATGIDDSAIPGTLKKVLDAVEKVKQDQFPYNLIEFIRRNRIALLSGFSGLFDTIDEDARAYLVAFLTDRSEPFDGAQGTSGVSRRLVERLQQVVAERESLLRKTKRLKTERERLKKLPDDEATREEIAAVDQERNALLSLLASLNNQLTLNFFTDEGLLPNYAFPEEGVTLRSVILRRRGKWEAKEGAANYDKLAYSFQRPAQAALSELAPENHFYAISHKMAIDQIDLQLAESEEWRFCDRCQYSERVDLVDKHSACPRCGSPQWQDGGQRHSVLKLRQVYSTVDDRKARIGDDAENREPSFFNRQMLVDIPPDGHQGGFRIDSPTLPFGFEFLRKASIREVNFGPQGGDANAFAVAGQEMPRKGFRICRHCGKVHTSTSSAQAKARRRKFDQPHAYSCKLRKKPEQEKPEDYFESLYLYRELNSEAIRVLLPLAEVAYSDVKLHSFIAALNLGLKAYFRGDVHHLEVTDMREPPTEGSSERIYLVIYDRIPGGTGYLKELMRQPENMLRVLELARDRLKGCACLDDETKDGCYRCILAYRNSRDMPTISRSGALELLDEILNLRDQLTPVEGLGEISTNALIESKLEQRFVEALAGLPGAQYSKQLINGKSGGLLTLPGTEGRPIAWQVEHQINLGPGDGVVLNTEVDVMLTPARAEDAARYRPIAVYMDGLQYHHAIVADDVCKRSAIALSGRYWVWTLGWDDLPDPGKPHKPHAVDLMRNEGPMQAQMQAAWQQLAEAGGWLPPAEHGAQHGLGGLEWLSRLLRKPDLAEGRLMQRAAWRAFTLLAPARARDGTLRQALTQAAGEQAPLLAREQLNLDAMTQIPGGLASPLENAPPSLELLASVPMAAIQTNDPKAIAEALRCNLCFDDRDTTLSDDFKSAWRSFWHAANQLQFLPGFTLATRQAVADGRLDTLWSSWSQLHTEKEHTDSDQDEQGGWAEVLKYSMLEEEEIRTLMDLGLPVPEVGVDLTSEDGEVVMDGNQVELCWREQRIAVISGDDAPPESAHPMDWRLVPANDNMVTALQELIGCADAGGASLQDSD
jgi:DEAD/DEAH box helicase domain-containing protein